MPREQLLSPLAKGWKIQRHRRESVLRKDSLGNIASDALEADPFTLSFAIGYISTLAASVAKRVVRTSVLAIANAISVAVAVGTIGNAITVVIALVIPAILTTILIRSVVNNTACQQGADHA
jgi:hypothetical protein